MRGDENDDPEAWALAYHEAGHVVACVHCAVQVTEAWIAPGERGHFHEGYNDDHWGLRGAVSHEPPSAADNAFIAWAGSYAEARFEAECYGGSAGDYILGLQYNGGASDMAVVEAYFNDDANAPHESEDHWADLIDLAWTTVEHWAERLVTERGIVIRER